MNEKDLSALASYTDTTKITRFYAEIHNFEKDDSINKDRKVDIIFTGSSTIRKWTTLQNDISGFKVINRGFGGSTIPEIIYYSDILIFKHQPSKIVFYAGENDLACPSCSPTKIIQSLEYFQKLVFQKLPNTHIYFISLKPSPARMKYWPTMQLINDFLDKLCSASKNCTFINVWDEMFDENHKVRMELFKPDRTHLTESGYEILTQKVQGALKTQNK